MSDTNGSQPTLTPIDALTKDPKNAKLHTDLDINAIAASLGAFGQQTPIVINAERVIIKGNGTYLAAMQLGWTEIKVVTTGLQGQQVRAYAIADNQTGLIANWDEDVLREQLAEIERDFAKTMMLEGFLPPLETEGKQQKEHAWTLFIEDVTQEHKEQVVAIANECAAEVSDAIRAAAY